ncbi:MAG: NPCBM/NEW2 domain-containing protein [Lentisphaeria bacterium]|nr:NPCBM/NEW2 domain-containing protein [Lentisphaeria bacterium]
MASAALPCAVEIRGGARCTVSGCVVRNVGGTGIAVNGGTGHTVRSCDVYAVGSTGIVLEGGDRKPLARGDHTVENCHNYFHNIHAPGKLGCFTVYPDLPCGGIHLYGNVFYDVDQVFHSNSGRGMVIENNLFLDCRRGLRFQVWMDKAKFCEGGNWRMVERLAEVAYDRPPYSTRYPALAQLARDFAKGEDHWLERALPRDNLICRNVSLGEHFLALGPQASLDHVRVERNVIADPVVFTGAPGGEGTPRTYRRGDAATQALFQASGNVLTAEDPGFADLAGQDFRLSPDSPAVALGFQPIPFADIGLRVDDVRAAVPLRAPRPVLIPGDRGFTVAVTVLLRPTPVPGQPPCILRYTLDGTEPGPGSAVYAAPLTLTDSATVKAASFVTRGTESVRSATVTSSFMRLVLRAGGVPLGDLEELELVGHASGCRRDRNHTGGPLVLGGRSFARGILLHPAEGPDGNIGRMTFALDGDLSRAKRLTALVGIDDSMHAYGRGSAGFAVEVRRQGAWERVYESDVRRLGDTPLPVDVQIAGADRLRLVTTDGGDGIGCDHAAGPMFGGTEGT